MKLHQLMETNLFNELSDQEQEVVAGGLGGWLKKVSTLGNNSQTSNSDGSGSVSGSGFNMGNSGGYSVNYNKDGVGHGSVYWTNPDGTKGAYTF